MDKILSLFKNSNGILLVIGCALFGYLISYSALFLNLRQPRHGQVIYYALDKATHIKKEIPNDSVAFSKATWVNWVFIPNNQILFNRNPVLLVWSMLIIIMFTITFGAIPVFCWQITQLKTMFNFTPDQINRCIFYSLIIISLIIVLQKPATGYYSPLTAIDDFRILFKSGTMLIVIVAAAIIFALPIISVIFMIGPASDKISYDLTDKSSTEKAVSNFEYLKQVLQNALQVLAIIIVLTVLTSGTLNTAFKSALTTKSFDVYPTQSVYVYGLLFSTFLGIIYIPVFVYLKLKNNDLRQKLVDYQNLQNETEAKWAEKVLSVMTANASSLDNLKIALTVLAPLITSFLPSSIQHFTQ